MTQVYRLYAMPHSLYSGRARSYLIKNAIGFQEFSSGHESFKRDVLPDSKLPTIPTLVTPAGEVIRDGAAIISHFEENRGWPSLPEGPRQRILSLLFDVIGTDGLLRPAMHYRWNFPESNQHFVGFHFFHSQRDMPERREKSDHMMGRMRHAAEAFGVTEESQSLVESLYQNFLEALNRHFEHVPYLFGWRPSIGDYGLLAPLYAHLGRDPHPARIMLQRAPRVYRWVERMNRLDHDMPEYFEPGSDFLENDAIPETLINVLQTLAVDFVPETEAAATVINAWLDSNQPASGVAAIGRLAEAPGMAEFVVRDRTMTALAQPHRFFLLQRVQANYEALTVGDQSAVQGLLSECGLLPVLDFRLSRAICRQGNLEVWDAVL
ncbi:MAG: glutathione S-transferase C-terminal domain-containing protein [Luminiphilus sp.]|nr:glutathione S-transferase C-terminal domain-containing protein [Luminiphilus sp.]